MAVEKRGGQSVIRKMDTRLRRAVTPQERLEITLRYLATDTPVAVSFQ